MDAAVEEGAEGGLDSLGGESALLLPLFYSPL